MPSIHYLIDGNSALLEFVIGLFELALSLIKFLCFVGFGINDLIQRRRLVKNVLNSVFLEEWERKYFFYSNPLRRIFL